MNYLLFAEADVETSNEAMLLPASSFTGCDPVSGGITLFFNDIEGGAAREAVTLNCANGNQKAVLDDCISGSTMDGKSEDVSPQYAGKVRAAARRCVGKLEKLGVEFSWSERWWN